MSNRSIPLSVFELLVSLAWSMQPRWPLGEKNLSVLLHERVKTCSLVTEVVNENLFVWKRLIVVVSYTLLMIIRDWQHTVMINIISQV